MLVAFEFLRVRQLAAASQKAILRFARGSVGAERFRRGCAGRRRGRACQALGGFGDLQPSDEPFQIALLFGLKVARDRLAS
jgi:hypothetical protein